MLYYLPDFSDKTGYANCPPVHGAPASSTGMNNGFAEGMLIGLYIFYNGV